MNGPMRIEWKSTRGLVVTGWLVFGGGASAYAGERRAAGDPRVIGNGDIFEIPPFAGKT